MQIVSATLTKMVEFALPRRCPGCGEISGEGDGFCPTCWGKCIFFGKGGCTKCGVPLPSVDLVCGACLANPPEHDGVVSVLSYNDVAQSVVLRYKYARRIGLAKFMARGLEIHAGDSPHALLVPVPLHRWRIWQRGFNQSALLAQELGRRLGHRVETGILLRHKATPPLSGLSRKERHRAVRAAFSISAKKAKAIKGADIFLVDDVYTTGATTNACAKLLKKHGAARVRVLCWARRLAEPDQGLDVAALGAEGRRL